MIALLLAVIAWLAPMPLYVASMSLFGLPHVIWEMTWLHRTAGPRLSKLWWGGLLMILGLQGAARLGVVLSLLEPQRALIADLLTLALALALVLLAPAIGCLRRGVALLAALGLSWVGLEAGIEMNLTLIALLSALHNLTPIGLTRLAEGSWRWMALPFLLMLPLLVLPVPWMWGLQDWSPIEAGLLQRLSGLPGWLPALVLAQCLHYRAVLRLLPGQLPPPVLLKGAWLWAALAFGALASLLFLSGFPEARRLYGVFSGMHAWAEWPILLALGGVADVKIPGPCAESSTGAIGGTGRCNLGASQ